MEIVFQMSRLKLGKIEMFLKQFIVLSRICVSIQSFMSVAVLKRVPMETPCVQLLADLRRRELWPRHQCSIWLPGPAVGLIKHLLPHLTLLQHCQIPTEDFLQKTTVVMKAIKYIPVSRLLTFGCLHSLGLMLSITPILGSLL